MIKRTIIGILFAFFFAVVQLNAQDLVHYKQIVKELSSSKYQGRGYAKDGANKAGKYLEKEFVKAGVFLENQEGDAFKYYHTIYDTYENAIFDSYEPVFRLVRDFVEQYH